MANDLKTRLSDASVTDFLESLNDESKKQDCIIVLNMMQEITGCQPKMWGDAIIGLGSYHYEYKSGREGDWMVVAVSPRKSYISVYLMSGVEGEEFLDLRSKLGKHSMGKSCLKIKRLSDINIEVLEQMIRASVTYMQDKYETTC